MLHLLTSFSRLAINRQIAIRRSYKSIKCGPEVRSLLLQGVDIVADAVAITMGPKGRSVVIEGEYPNYPKITKDGVTVARSVVVENKFKKIGAKLLQDVTNNTDEEVGDGTTTTTVLARAIAAQTLAEMSKGANIHEIRNGIVLAVDVVKKHLEVLSRPVQRSNEIAQVATISANGDEIIGNLISEAIKKVGHNGNVTINEGYAVNDELEIIEGIKFDSGYVSTLFNNCETKNSRVEFKNPYVLFTEAEISSFESLEPAIKLANVNGIPLVIIADDIDTETIAYIVASNIKNITQVAAVRAPGFKKKEMLKSMAIAGGGIVFGNDANSPKLEDVSMQNLGKFDEVVITETNTLLLRGRGDHNNIQPLNYQNDDGITDMTPSNEKGRLLASGIAVVSVGGHSKAEINERKDRMIDALNAARAALEGGIVAGGGVALIRCIPKLEHLQGLNNDQSIGIEIIRRALRIPGMTIAKNAGVDGAVVVSEIEKSNADFGYDALECKYGNLIEKGIIDPTKVVCAAITDAADIANLLTTTEVVITNTPGELMTPMQIVLNSNT